MRVRIVAGVAAALFALAAPVARAQVIGLPLYNGGIPSGIGLYGDVGFANTDYGKGKAFGATGRLGFGPLGVTATIANFNPSGPVGGRATYGGTANLRVFGGPFIPVSVTLQGGIGYIKSDDANLIPSSTHVPIGVGIGIRVPSPVLSFRPWIAPRIDVNRTKLGTVGNTDTNFGISGGIEANTLGGFGVQLAYDRVWAGNGVNPSLFGVGAHYA